MVVAAESVARFAGLLADPTRATMCLALIDGRAWTVAELARHAGVARSTASEHLTALVAAGLLAEERQGRHRYLRLAGPAVATLIEDITGIAGHAAPRPLSWNGVRAARELAAARTCYDHLAGALGVTLYEALLDNRLIDLRTGLALTSSGRDWFIDLAGESAVRPHGSRPLLRTCLDWTERRHHLGGSLGAVLHQQLADRGWIIPSARHRAVAITHTGADSLCRLLGCDLHPLVAATRSRPAG